MRVAFSGKPKAFERPRLNSKPLLSRLPDREQEMLATALHHDFKNDHYRFQHPPKYYFFATLGGFAGGLTNNFFLALGASAAIVAASELILRRRSETIGQRLYHTMKAANQLLSSGLITSSKAQKTLEQIS